VKTKGGPKWVVNCHCSQCRRALSATYATLAGDLAGEESDFADLGGL